MMVTTCGVNVFQSSFTIFSTHHKSFNSNIRTLNPIPNFTHHNSWNSKIKTVNPIPNFNSLKCHSSATSPQNHFTVSYLVTNLGFSLEAATKASKLVHFTTSEKPDSVIATFRILGFSDSQINRIVRISPNILTGDPHKRILPKFQFLLSKGASCSHVVEIVVRNPRILYASLDNSIIPTFDLVTRLFSSNDQVIQYLLKSRGFFGHHNFVNNVNLLLDHGVPDSKIRNLLRHHGLFVLTFYDVRSALDMVKKMGFNDPSKFNFCMALLAKSVIPKSQWDAKVDVFKRWGWSDEMFLEAFRNQPRCMLSSKEKINSVMRFWVNELGWNSSALVKRGDIFKFSLENRIIPRACVLSYLISKGLIENNVEVSTPFVVKEEVFLEKYVQCFKEERHNLLKLYLEKMDGKKIKENGEASVSY